MNSSAKARGFIPNAGWPSVHSLSMRLKMGTNLGDTSRKYTLITAAIILALLAARVVGVLLTPLHLGPDEAQYWRWGQSFEWGYYSKPPMIAWVIGGLTNIFGDQEWAVRLASPFLHTLAAAFLFLLGRKMFSPRVGMFAALGYALMPGVILSSGIISTDGVLLPFFSIAVFCLWSLREGGDWRYAIGLGAAIGIGFLSKYAMLYFAIGIALTILIDAPTRKTVVSLNGGIAFAVSAVIFAPHMIWNANNGFQTVKHTADNANLGAELFNFENAIDFLANQMSIFGPVGFLTLIMGMFVLRGQAGATQYQKERWLLCFILPVLIIIFIQSIVSRAHANWAATAYPAASVLVAAWLTRAGANRSMWLAIAAITFVIAFAVPGVSFWVKIVLGAGLGAAILGSGFLAGYKPVGLLWTAIGIHAAIAGVFTVVAVGPVSVSEQLGLANAFKRTRGWEETTDVLANAAEKIGATALLVDEREVWHGLDYYGRSGFPVPIYNWRRYGGIKSFADTDLLTEDTDDVVLIASIRKRFRPRIKGDFEQIEEIGYRTIPLGGGKNRTFKLYRASGFQPLARTNEWEDFYRDQAED